MRYMAILLGFVVAAGAAFVLSPRDAMAAHDSGLLERVNEAIREAGAPVTLERSNAFQKGVVNGHYTSYSQLVGAIIFHKDAEALPVFTALTQHEPAEKECITKGDVLSMSNERLTVRGDLENGSVVTRAFDIAINQYDFAIAKGVSVGSNIKVCSIDNFVSQYGHVTKN